MNSSNLTSPYDLDQHIWYLPWWQSIISPYTSMLFRILFIQVAICFPQKISAWRNKKVQTSEQRANCLYQVTNKELLAQIKNRHLVNVILEYSDPTVTMLSHEERINHVMIKEYQEAKTFVTDNWSISIDFTIAQANMDASSISNVERDAFGNMYQMSFQYELLRGGFFVLTLAILVSRFVSDIYDYSFWNCLQRSASRISSIGFASAIGLFKYISDDNPDFPQVHWSNIHTDSSGKYRHPLVRFLLFIILWIIFGYTFTYIIPAAILYMPSFFIILFFKIIIEWFIGHIQKYVFTACLSSTHQGAVKRLLTILAQYQILMCFGEISTWCVPPVVYFYHGQSHGAQWWRNFEHTFSQKAESRIPATWHDWIFLINSLL